jgi:uncharacterized protein YeaO (DUF488 family)
MIQAKRVYEAPAAEDGYRVLIDRLWPRGLSKSRAKVDLWLKDVAVSDALRRWYGHDVAKWPEFRKRFMAELRKKPGALSAIKKLADEHGTVTLLFGAKDARHCNATVLIEMLKK